MSIDFLRCRSRVFLLLVNLVTGLLLPAFASIAGETIGQIDVVVDQARLIKLPDHASTIVVGNPMIADVTLQAGGMLIVTGKSYGATNIVAMDPGGKILSDRVVEVKGPTDKLVTVYRGVERESYSCTPVCQRRVTLGDTPTYFSATLGQAGNFGRQAADSAKAAAANNATSSSSVPASSSDSSSSSNTSPSNSSNDSSSDD